MATFRFPGVEGAWHGDALAQRVQQAAQEAARAIGGEVLADALTQVPRDTEQLAESGVVEDLEAGIGVRVTFGKDAITKPAAGAPSSYYAIKQHEDMTLNHPRGGKAKYLEDPTKANAREAGQRMADAVRGAH